MGTNFYIVGDFDEYEHETVAHIGKRYARGLYCWDCKIPTESLIGDIGPFKGMIYSAKTCAKCGQSKSNEDLNSSTAGRELGFNKSTPAKKTGVASCSGFIWAREPSSLENIAEIEDEYGRKYTREEFLQILEECPVQEFDSIGKNFS